MAGVGVRGVGAVTGLEHSGPGSTVLSDSQYQCTTQTFMASSSMAARHDGDEVYVTMVQQNTAVTLAAAALQDLVTTHNTTNTTANTTTTTNNNNNSNSEQHQNHHTLEFARSEILLSNP